MMVMLLALIQSAWAKEPVTVIAEGRVVFENLNRDEAKARAVRQAYKNGIREALGVVVQSQSFVKDGLFAGEFVHAISYGNVIAEKILEQKFDVWQKTPDSDPVPIYYVKMELTVQAQEGEPDPSFKVDVKLNKTGFTAGEEMWMTVRATQPCYIMVLNIDANNDIYPLFPNEHQPDHFLKPGEVLEIPPKARRELGLRIRVQNLPGHRQDREYIKVIATKRPICFLDEVEEKNGMKVFKNDQIALSELGQWLCTLRVDERAEDVAVYTITADD